MWSLPIESAKGVIFVGDGRVIIGAGGFEPISGWDIVKRGRLFDSGDTYSDVLTGIIGSRDGTVLATAGADRTARAWDIRTGRELKRLPYRDYVSVAVSPNGTLLASSGTDPFSKRRLLEITELRPENSYREHLREFGSQSYRGRVARILFRRGTTARARALKISRTGNNQLPNEQAAGRRKHRPHFHAY